MERKIFILTLCLLTSFLSCKKVPLSNGPKVTQTRELPDFNEVHVNDNISISLVRSDTCYIDITTGKNIIDNITTEVNNGILTICNTSTCNWIRPYDFELHATLYFKDIRNFIFSSAGTLDTRNDYTGQINNDDFYRFEIDGGSGDVELNINNCNELHLVYQYGTSRLNIHGENNKKLTIYKNSYGIIDASCYDAETVNVTTHSHSDCYISASKCIYAEINSLGNIYYKGEPTEIHCDYGEFSRGRLIHID